MRNQVDKRWTYLGRLAHIAVGLVRFYPLHWLNAAVHHLPWLGQRLAPIQAPPQRFRAMLEALGGSFIKFGQILSLQPDLIPRSYCEELFDLLDRVPPFSTEDVERIFSEDLGAPPSEIFDDFEPRPFGSASIGQVHRARLDGRDLAVKVRRPTAQRDFGGDIRLMSVALRLITTLRLRKLYAFRIPIGEFIAWTTDELDYRIEARYMRQVGLNTGDSAAARIPEVIHHASTSRILTTEYLHGTTLLEYLRSLKRNDPAVEYRLEQIGFDPAKFADNIIANFLGDVFEHGLFHADLHPANLLILPGNTVGYVDFGITGVISEYGREHVLALILAFSRCDVDEICDGILRISEITDESDVERFRRGLDDLADRWFERIRGVPKLVQSYTVIMLELLRLSRECQLLPHEEAVRYMRSVITADGLISRFAPEYDVAAGLERLSKKHLQRGILGDALSTDRMIETWIAGSRMLRDGALRLDTLLDRLESEAKVRPMDAATDLSPAGRTGAAKAARLGLIILVVACLLILGDESPPLGFNLFSAELLLLAAGILLLTRTALRWLGKPH